MSVDEAWERIDRWHRDHVRPDFLRLAAGASEEAITALERRIGVRLPEDVRRSYALHDGANGAWLLHYGEFLTLDGIAEQWEMMKRWQEEDGWGLDPETDTPKRIRGPIKAVWWNPLRIPVTDNSGDHAFIDLDPAPGGTVGQVIDHSHETGPSEVLAPSFGRWLEELAAGLEAGRYVYDEEAETVAPPGYYDGGMPLGGL